MLNYDEVLDHIIEQVSRVVSLDAACILLIEGDTARVARWRGYGLFGHEGTIAAARFTVSSIPSLLTVLETGEAVIVSQVEAADPWLIQSSQSWVKAYVNVPIGTSSRSGPNQSADKKRNVIGFLHVASTTAGAYVGVEVDLLQVFVDQAAVALANARLFDQARLEIVERVRALKMERNFVSAILDTAGALIIILSAQGRILRINRACERISGYSLSEVRGKYFWDLFVPPEEKEGLANHFEKLRHGQVPSEYENSWITHAGEHRIIAWRNTALFDSAGAVEFIIGIGIDITERKQAEEALRESEERYALAALSASDGLWDWNLKTNKIYFSSRWKSMLGCREEEIGDSPIEWFSRIHPEDLPQLKADICDYLEGRVASTTPLKNEHRILHQDGRYRWVLGQGLAVWAENGQPTRLAGSQTDITQRKLAEAQLMHSAFHDVLTGLPNRTLFRERLEQAIEQANEDQAYRFAVLFLDLDRFKVINDSLGHLVGDELLVVVARRIKAQLRPDDMVARLGGDEFAILLSSIPSTDQVAAIAERIQLELAKPIVLQEQRIFTASSIGIAIGSADYDWPDEILRDADMAMYQAKSRGRARYELFRADMRTQLEEMWQLEAELRHALERAELQLYYQPIVSLVDGSLAGVEALLRWQHPERGLVEPIEFIPLAEEIGLIAAIGAWVLRAACVQMAAWHAAGSTSLRVSVNVSPFQLKQPSPLDTLPFEVELLPNLVKRVLAETGLSPQALELEITESIAMLNQEFSLAMVEALSELGVRIAVDDFGLGSALDFLTQFPISTLKIDQSFVRNMTGDSRDAAFIAAIIAMAHSLKLKVVAEGIETDAQLTLLKAQQCDEVQGYLLSRPLSATMITELLEAEQRLRARSREG